MIKQVQLLWTGFTGAPGYTTLNFAAGPDVDPAAGMAAAEAADDFATAIAGGLSSGTSIVVGPEVKWFDTATGVLVGVTPVDPAFAPHTGISGALGPVPCGAVISWSTDGINRGRKVRGRTFLVPLAAAAYQSDGTLTSTVVSAFTTAASALLAADDADLHIWSRPRDGAGGASFAPSSFRVPDMAAVLRSRRD